MSKSPSSNTGSAPSNAPPYPGWESNANGVWAPPGFNVPADFGDGISNGVSQGPDFAIDPTTLPGWSPEQGRQLSPAEQRVEALGGRTSWHGTSTSNQSPWEAQKSLTELGWNPSMGYGPQNWAAMGVTNPAVAAQLNNTLFGISPMTQTEKQNWHPTVWRSPVDIARAQDAYTKTAGLYNSPGPALALAKRLEQKGYGWFGPERPTTNPTYTPPQSQTDPATAMRQQADRYASLNGGVMPEAMQKILGMFPNAPASQQPGADIAPAWRQYNLPAWGTGNAQNTTLQSILGL